MDLQSTYTDMLVYPHLLVPSLVELLGYRILYHEYCCFVLKVLGTCMCFIIRIRHPSINEFVNSLQFRNLPRSCYDHLGSNNYTEKKLFKPIELVGRSNAQIEF